MAHPETLLVFLNPYAAPLDRQGRPTAVYPWDPHHISSRGWVGARLHADGDRVVPVYDEGPISIPFLIASNHYRRGIAHGDLFAADVETLKRCGFPADQFRDPHALLAEARARAIAEWKTSHPGEVPAIEASSPQTAAPPATAAEKAPAADAPKPAGKS